MYITYNLSPRKIKSGEDGRDAQKYFTPSFWGEDGGVTHTAALPNKQPNPIQPKLTMYALSLSN